LISAQKTAVNNCPLQKRKLPALRYVEWRGIQLARGDAVGKACALAVEGLPQRCR
jgi:hypothetical protein